MNVQQLSVKIFARSSDIDQAALIPIFHDWIRDKRLGDDILLIDVADYRHVVDGPGVMLIAHEGHYGMDEASGLGLRFARKRDDIGAAAERLRDAFGRALLACDALENEPSLAGRLTFDAGDLEVRVMSRLVAPNTPAAYAELEPALAAFLKHLYGTGDIACEHLADARQPLGARVRIQGAPAAGALHARLSG